MAVAVALGGGMGYVKAKSVPSLAAGVGCGALFAAAGMMITQGEDKQGHAIATGTGLLLALGMGPRGIRTGKIMPLGIATLGLFSAAYNAKKTHEVRTLVWAFFPDTSIFSHQWWESD